MEFSKLDFSTGENNNTSKRRGVMRKILSEKAIALGLVFIAFMVAFYFYQRGEVSFSSKKEKNEKKEEKIVEMLFTEKQYSLSYQDKRDSSFEIANFENSENWQGDGEFDYTTFFEGESSLFLSSADNRKASVFLTKRFKLEEALKFRFLVHLETDPADLEEFNLIFTDEKLKDQYKFAIRDLVSGWNFLSLPRERFSHSISGDEESSPSAGVQKVLIELISRPQTRSIVNLDSLWAEKEENYLEDWNTPSPEILSIKKSGETDALLILNKSGTQKAVLKRIGSAKNYTFQAKFTPKRQGGFGLFLRGNYKNGDGYYLMVDGAGTDTWQMIKSGVFDEKRENIVLEKGRITNFQLEKNKPCWLKAEMQVAKIVFYFSLDNKNFTKLAEVRNEDFSSGGVGIAVSGASMVFVDDLQFFQ